MKNLMKFLLTITVCLTLAQIVSAQTVGQGAWMVGGSAGFLSQKVKDADESSTWITFQPNLGYFIADDLAIGLSLNLTSFSPAGSDESSTDFGLGPFVRFYFVENIFAQAGVNLGLGDAEFTEFQVGVGYSWFLNDGVAIEPMLFYNSHSVDGDIGDFSTFGLLIGIQAFANHEHGME